MKFFCSILIAALCGVFLPNQSAHASEIVIGQPAPLTGVLAASGKQLSEGAKIYFSYVNDHGGVNGSKIRHVVEDDGYKIEETVRVAKKLIEEDKAIALIGCAGSANTAALLSEGVLAAHNTPLISPLTGSVALRTPFNPYIFHIRASYADEMEFMVNHLTTVGIKNIGVLYQNDLFGKGGLESITKAMEARGEKVAVSASYERGTDDVAAAVKTIRAVEPAAIIMVSVNRPTAAFIRNYRESGGKAQLLNISVVDAGEIAHLAGFENTYGLGITQVMPYPYAALQTVVKEYLQLFKKYAPPESTPSYASLETFIGAKILVEALKHAGKNPSSDQLMHALEALDNYDVGGFTVGFSPTNRVGSKFVEITLVGRKGNILR